MHVSWAYDVALALAGDLDQHRAWRLIIRLTDGYDL
jgi:hypothetical protein